MATQSDKDEVPSLEINLKKGVAQWPKLNTPDKGTDQFPKPDGEWSVKLCYYEGESNYEAARKIFDDLDRKYDEWCSAYEAEYPKLIQNKIDAWTKATKKKGTKPVAGKISRLSKPWKEIEDERGKGIQFGLKMKAQFEDREKGEKIKQSPAIFDAKKNRFDKPWDKKGKFPLPNIGSGTIMSVSGRADFFVNGETNIGITLKLKGVQIIVLKQYTGKSAEEYGFEEEDGEDTYDATAQADEDDEGETEVDLSE